MARVETMVAMTAKTAADQTVDGESSAPDPVPGNGPSCLGAEAAEIKSMMQVQSSVDSQMPSPEYLCRDGER